MATRRIVRLITSVFDRASAVKAEGDLVRSLATAGQQGGEKAGREFIRELRTTFNVRMAKLREDLASGLINQREFRKQADIASRTFNDSLIANIRKARAEGRLTDQEYIKLSRNLKRTGDQGTSAWDRIRRGVTAAGIALASFFALHQLRRFGAMLFDLGAAAEETQSKFSTTFGQSTESVQTFIDTFANLAGLNNTVAQEMIATAGTIAQGMGFAQDASAEFSEQIIKLAGDLQSFHNVPIEETFRAIRSGLVGEAEPMRRFGVMLNVASTEAKALEMTGKALASQLTEQEKAVARLTQMYEQAGPAIGDLERTKESTANTARRLRAEFEDIRIELATALLPAFDSLLRTMDEGRWAQRTGTAVKFLADNLRTLLDLVVALGKATAITGVAFGLNRLRVAILAANVATLTFTASLRTLMASLGPVGWIALLGSLAAGFFNAGKAARDAARDATQAAREMQGALSGMSRAAIETRLNITRTQIEVLSNELNALIASGAAITSDRVTEIHASMARLNGILAETQRAWEEVNAVAPGGPAGDPANDPVILTLQDEIKLLEQGNKLRILTVQERERAHQLLIDTHAELNRVNLSLERRIELTNRLLTLQGISPTVRPGITGIGTQAPGGTEGLNLTPVTLPPPAPESVSAWQLSLEDIQNTAGITANYMTRAFDDFFTAMANGFDTTREGFHSLSDAALGVGASIVAGLAGGFRDYHMAMGVGKLAEGAWPPNPAAIGAASLHFAAAGLFGALESILGSAGRKSGVSPATAPPQVGRQASDRAERGAEVNIFFSGEFDMLNPQLQRAVLGTVERARERFGENAKITAKPSPG